MKRYFLLCLLALAPSCRESVPSPVHPLFQPSAGILPVPNDLLFGGSLDGTLNMPVLDPADLTDPTASLSRLDGWSVIAPFTIGFDDALDAASVTAGRSVRMFQVTTDPAVPIGGNVTGVVRELGAAEFSASLADEDPAQRTIRITPLRALQENATYMVVLTNLLRGITGRVVAAPSEFTIALSGIAGTQLDAPLQAMVHAAESVGVPRDSIVLTMQFTTQDTGSVLQTLHDVARGGEQAIIDALVASGFIDPAGGSTTANTPPASIAITPVVIGASPGGFADIETGAFTLPYFLTAASNSTVSGTSNDPAPLLSVWSAHFPVAGIGDTERSVTRFNPLPAATGPETVPVLVTIPNTAATGLSKPATGWPVVIFQHGITGNRTNLLGIADTLALSGMVAVAIDLPLHGVDPTDPFFVGYLDGGLRERTFGIDFQDEINGLPIPDGIPDSSGANFINLSSLLTSRDNIRQGVSDLFELASVLGSIDLDGDLVPDLDTAHVTFLGHSLGGMIGTDFLRFETSIQAATLAMPGGGIPKLLEGSAAFGPVIAAGLAGAGLFPNTPDWEGFMFAAQTVVDSGDPLAHASLGHYATLPLHFLEVVGGGLNPPDLVVPNHVPEAPLAGSDPLIARLGLTQYSASATDAAGLHAVVRFTAGDHSSILDPAASLDVFNEMQAETGIFLSSFGTTLTITNGSVVQ